MDICSVPNLTKSFLLVIIYIINVCKGADIKGESDTLLPALLLRPLIIIIISFISETKTLPFGFLKYPQSFFLMKKNTTTTTDTKYISVYKVVWRLFYGRISC